jgi:hypothetical protein
MEGRRWAIIDEDGTHMWLNRGVEPTPEHLLAVPVALDARGVGAWLVAVSGDYWFDEEVEAQAVRLLTRRAPSAEAVVEAFRRRRIATLSSVAKAGGVEARRDRPHGPARAPQALGCLTS